MHIHILGICGTFMGGIAAIARAAGHRVTGCDANVYPPMSTQLQAMGIDLIEGFAAGQLALRPELFVIGNVVSRGNPLMEAILNEGARYISGPQWVGENLLTGKHVLAVAGTHGKTTTSSMLAWILEYAGLRPGFLIGGVPENFDVSARAAAAQHFVIEADEYDTAFFDKRSKFVHYRPLTAILNNLEYDHADIFPDLGAIEIQFHHLVRTVPQRGRLIVNGVDASLARVLARGCWSGVERFGAPDAAGWQAGNAAADGGFDILFQSALQGHVRWDLFGAHNRMNALAAIAAARHAGVEPRIAIEALGQFKNVKRRMEVRGVVAGVTVYDDFAHHPTAIATTIEGLRHKLDANLQTSGGAIGAASANTDGSKSKQPGAKTNTGARILAVLEPRSNTMKLGAMKAQLPGSLAGADLVFGYGAATGKDALGWDLGQALRPLGAKAFTYDALEPLVGAVLAASRRGDHVLVMSNGGFGGVHQKILDGLKKLHPG